MGRTQFGLDRQRSEAVKKKILPFILLLAVWTSRVAVAETVWYPLPEEAYKFGDRYPEAQRLLFAFDYGHALVYERLLLRRGHIDDPAAFEAQILGEVFAILKDPPHVKMDETDIAPQYSFTFPKTLTLFDWSHLLHQFVLDAMATQKDRTKMKARVNELFAIYKANKRIAITDQCKTMLFMDGQYFSKSFRRTYPSFNLLIWSYHWFQIKLYEALLQPTLADQDKAVAKAIADFRALISDLPDSADFDMMPSNLKEAPSFGALFPKIAAAFDNNHMLHDIVSDILTSDKIPDNQIRAEGLRTADMDLDPNAFKASDCNQP